MKEQVREGIEQSLESEVKKEMFFDEENQKDVIEPENKSIKENVS